jgi:hypothetical protein
MEIDPISLEKYLPPPWSPDYDLLHMPRHVASPNAVNFLANMSEKFPQAQSCVLESIPTEARTSIEQLSTYIGNSAAKSGCPSGIYMVEGFAFRVDVGTGAAVPLEIQTKLSYGK